MIFISVKIKLVNRKHYEIVVGFTRGEFRANTISTNEMKCMRQLFKIAHNNKENSFYFLNR